VCGCVCLSGGLWLLIILICIPRIPHNCYYSRVRDGGGEREGGGIFYPFVSETLLWTVL
jgi:hypothetical protein